MNRIINITAILDQPGLLENLVERLASRRYDIGYCNERVPADWQPVEISSTETYISGTLELSGLINSPEPINLPFITSMLFTCVKAKDDHYRLLWSSSLS
jgi:hypothetical protein